MTNSNKPKEAHFLTVKEAAVYLRLCEKQVRRLISKGELAAYRFGTVLRISKDDIDAYVVTKRVIPVKISDNGGNYCMYFYLFLIIRKFYMFT